MFKQHVDKKSEEVHRPATVISNYSNSEKYKSGKILSSWKTAFGCLGKQRISLLSLLSANILWRRNPDLQFVFWSPKCCQYWQYFKVSLENINIYLKGFVLVNSFWPWMAKKEVSFVFALQQYSFRNVWNWGQWEYLKT